MILCSKWKNGLRKIVTKSQVVTKFSVTKSRLHCITIRPNHNMGPFTSYYSKYISFYRYTHTKREGRKVRMKALYELIFFYFSTY